MNTKQITYEEYLVWHITDIFSKDKMMEHINNLDFIKLNMTQSINNVDVKQTVYMTIRF